MFTTNPVQLNKLLDEIEAGNMQLPEFQRSWIWEDHRIRDLLRSVAQGYPIGAVMRLDAGGELNFKSRPIEGAPGGDDPVSFVLDGQQRLTSLYQSLKFPGPVDTHNSARRKVKRWYYVDMVESLRTSPDLDKMIFSVPESKQLTSNIGRVVELDLSSPGLEYEQHMFPTECIFDPVDWLLGYMEHWSGKIHSFGNPRSFYSDFDNKIIKSFSAFELPVIDLDKSLPREAVCVVFDKVNTGGVALTTFELLTAMLAAEEYDLRRDWSGRQTRIKDSDKVLAWVDKDQFIRVVALLVTSDRRRQAIRDDSQQIPPVRCTRSEILSINRKEYEKCADKAEAGFKQAARFLTGQSIYNAREIPYMTQLTSLAYIFASAGQMIFGADSQSRLARWFWSGIFGEVYGGPTETLVANDAVRVPRFLSGDAPLAILDEVTFEPARLLSLRTRNTAAYKGVNALLLKAGATDWISNEPINVATYYDQNIDIHHVFPKHWCETQSNRLFGQAIPHRIFNCAINKTPLSSRTNRIIGGSAPSVYIERIRRHRSDVEDAILGHDISVDHLANDDFASFFVDRGVLLMRLIGDAMGKPLDDGREVFQRALLAENLIAENDEYDDQEEYELVPQIAE